MQTNFILHKNATWETGRIYMAKKAFRFCLDWFGLNCIDSKLTIHFARGSSCAKAAQDELGKNHLGIWLYRDDDFFNNDILARAVIHEMTHVKQCAFGELKNAKGKNMVIWKGKLYPVYFPDTPANTKKYDRSPWEIEAVKMEHLLLPIFNYFKEEL